MRYQAQTFIKQVQVDLLALSDADLLHTIDQWGPAKERSEPGLPHDALEAACFALGYTRSTTETEHVSYLPGTMPEAGSETRGSWLAPAPEDLRNLLMEMDAKQFAQHVITIAFHSLHTLYPEWGDGSTFNAHLANYLRQIRITRQRHEQGAKKLPPSR